MTQDDITEKFFQKLDVKNLNGSFISNRTISEIAFIQGEKRVSRNVVILLTYSKDENYTISLSQKVEKLENNKVHFLIDGKFFLFLEFDNTYTRNGRFVLSKILPKN